MAYRARTHDYGTKQEQQPETQREMQQLPELDVTIADFGSFVKARKEERPEHVDDENGCPSVLSSKSLLKLRYNGVVKTLTHEGLCVCPGVSVRQTRDGFVEGVDDVQKPITPCCNLSTLCQPSWFGVRTE